LVFLAEASRGVGQTLAELRETPVSLDPENLPEYAARTSLRMLAAMVLSLLFTFTYATWAAKSRRAEVLLIPLLDILQSVPILGFLSVTVVFFMSLAPGKVLGAEFAAIFAIFTSQAWNMAFSFYQSLRTVPEELVEASRCFGLSPWMRFWRLEVPFAMPPLVWNMMVSMSGGWFFVVASEAISVGDTTVALPGIGSYIALAIRQRDLAGIGWAIAAMLMVILIYDQTPRCLGGPFSLRAGDRRHAAPLLGSDDAARLLAWDIAKGPVRFHLAMVVSKSTQARQPRHEAEGQRQSCALGQYRLVRGRGCNRLDSILEGRSVSVGRYLFL
jgi:ABC-type nitrate/sulfonate/bicarbonate transport system permease component